MTEETESPVPIANSVPGRMYLTVRALTMAGAVLIWAWFAVVADDLSSRPGLIVLALVLGLAPLAAVVALRRWWGWLRTGRAP